MAESSPAQTARTASSLLAICASLGSVALVAWPLVTVGLAAAAAGVLAAAWSVRGPARVLPAVALLLSLTVFGAEVLLLLSAR